MAKNLFDIGKKRRRSAENEANGGAASPFAPGAASAPQNTLARDYGTRGTSFAAASSGTRGTGSTSSNAAESGNGGGAAPQGGSNTQGGSFDDYYTRLIEALHSYGINMELPTLEELYDQLAAFLRPSVDAAIENRRNYGETVLAELDADAYSRGMGGSSYLSSMKNREYDAAASDIAAMESNYNATLAQYLYNASNELRNIQAQFEEIRRQHEYETERMRAEQQHELALERMRERHAMELARQRSYSSGSGRSGGSGGASGNGQGGSGGSAPQLTEEQYEANYNAYVAYMRLLSPAERRNVFTGTDPYWAGIRNEMIANLTDEAYERLRLRFLRGSGGSGTDPMLPHHTTE